MHVSGGKRDEYSTCSMLRCVAPRGLMADTDRECACCTHVQTPKVVHGRTALLMGIWEGAVLPPVCYVTAKRDVVR